MRSLLVLLAALCACSGDDERVDCSEWLEWMSGAVPDAGPLPDGGGYNLGRDFYTPDPRCVEMHPPR